MIATDLLQILVQILSVNVPLDYFYTGKLPAHMLNIPVDSHSPNGSLQSVLLDSSCWVYHFTCCTIPYRGMQYEPKIEAYGWGMQLCGIHWRYPLDVQ